MTYPSESSSASSASHSTWTARSNGGSSDGLKDRVESAAADAKSHAAKAAQPVKEKAWQVAQEQKNVFADRIGGFASAMDTAAEDVAARHPATGDVLRFAAGSMKDASQSLRDKSLEDITGAVGRFARNRPAAFFAGAVVAGVALSRLLKSSSTKPTER